MLFLSVNSHKSFFIQALNFNSKVSLTMLMNSQGESDDGKAPPWQGVCTSRTMYLLGLRSSIIFPLSLFQSLPITEKPILHSKKILKRKRGKCLLPTFIKKNVFYPLLYNDPNTLVKKYFNPLLYK